MRVELQDIRVEFRGVKALDGVSVALEPGQVHVLVGPNGAGKSTLMGVLLGLVRPDGGRIVIDGAAHARPPMALKERLGYLPEAVAFADNLSGRQVLRFFAAARGLKRALAEDALARVGLAHAAGRSVAGYSRGMRQRLGLAVATLGDPELLILDEPTGGLDQEGLSLLWEILASRREAGKLTLASTHDLALIERRADTLCVLRAGQVRASGSPESLRRQVGLPARLRVELRDRGVIPGLVAALQAHPIHGYFLQGSGLVVEIPPEALLAALRTLDGYAAVVEHLRVEEPGLDAIYERLLEVA